MPFEFTLVRRSLSELKKENILVPMDFTIFIFHNKCAAAEEHSK